MLNKHKQTGLSPLGVLFVVCVFAAAVYTALNIIPHYLDYFSIKSIFEEIVESPSQKDLDENQMHNLINKRFIVNNIRSVNSRDIAFLEETETGEIMIGFDYQVTQHVAGNASALLKFSYEAQLK